MSNEFLQPCFTITEAAKYLKVSRSFVRKLIKDCRVKAIEISGQTIIRGAELERLLDQQPAVTAESARRSEEEHWAQNFRINHGFDPRDLPPYPEDGLCQRCGRPPKNRRLCWDRDRFFLERLGFAPAAACRFGSTMRTRLNTRHASCEKCARSAKTRRRGARRQSACGFPCRWRG
jgi:excisionase family DNA binding protein